MTDRLYPSPVTAPTQSPENTKPAILSVPPVAAHHPHPRGLVLIAFSGVILAG
jgi:hypothetical protein